MADDSDGGPSIGRRALLGGIGPGIAALAGCNTDGGGSTSIPNGGTPTPRDTPTKTTTETATETPTETDQPTQTPTPSITPPVEGFTPYEERLQEVDADDRLNRTLTWNRIGKRLEGKDGYEAAEWLANFHKDRPVNRFEPEEMYAWAKRIYQAQENGMDIPDLMINADYIHGANSQPILSISPVENGEPQEPVVASPFVVGTPDGGGELIEGLKSVNAVQVPYHVEATQTKAQRVKEARGEETAQKYRKYRQETMSYGIHGIDEDADVIVLDNALYNARFHDAEDQIINEFNRTVGDHLDSEGILGAAYDEEEGWQYGELEDFEYGDEFPDPSTVI